MIQTIGTFLVALSAALAWAVCVLYHLSARWWVSEVGRHVMTFTGILAAVLTLWTAGALWSDGGAAWRVARLVAFTGVPVCLAWRLWILYRLQIRPELRREKTRSRKGT